MKEKGCEIRNQLFLVDYLKYLCSRRKREEIRKKKSVNIQAYKVERSELASSMSLN